MLPLSLIFQIVLITVMVLEYLIQSVEPLVNQGFNDMCIHNEPKERDPAKLMSSMVELKLLQESDDCSHGSWNRLFLYK